MICFKNVSFKYHGNAKQSLESIDLRIRKNEFVLLVGRSGCGKTTVTRLINGLIPHFFEGELEGDVLIDQRKVPEMPVHQIARMVGSVFQDPRSQFFTVDTTSELAFPCENYGVHRDEIKSRIIKTISRLNMEQLLDRNIFRLSSGEKQKIAIGSTYTMNPSIYVFDEPSANLDVKATDDLREILGELKSQGHTIIIAEHKLYYLKDLVDRVIYMDKGRIVDELDAKSFKAMPYEERGRRGLRCIDPETILIPRREDYKNVNTGLSISKMSFWYNNKARIINKMELHVNGGEVIGIIGSNGAGKSTLARVICGLLKEKEGAIMIGSRKKPADRITSAYLVMQDTDYQLFTESVEEELKLGSRKCPMLFERINETMEELDLLDLKSRHPASLSGGQKQRVALAISAIRDSRIILLDEPTSGLDAENMFRVKEIINKLAREGRIVLIISHDYEFIINTCSRILHLEREGVTKDYKLDTESVDLFRDQMLKIG